MTEFAKIKPPTQQRMVILLCVLEVLEEAMVDIGKELIKPPPKKEANNQSIEGCAKSK